MFVTFSDCFQAIDTEFIVDQAELWADMDMVLHGGNSDEVAHKVIFTRGHRVLLEVWFTPELKVGSVYAYGPFIDLADFVLDFVPVSNILECGDWATYRLPDFEYNLEYLLEKFFVGFNGDEFFTLDRLTAASRGQQADTVIPRQANSD